MSTQNQTLEQCSADVRACREDVRTSTAQLNSKIDAVLRMLGQQASQQTTTITVAEELKRARAESTAASASSPLDDNEIFGAVLSYVGYGEYFYVAKVCRKWRGAYISLCHRLAKAAEKHKLRTRASAVVVTAARLQLAFDNGAEVAELDSTEHLYGISLGSAAVMWSLEPVTVLTLLRLYGYVWKSSIYEHAARDAKLELMQWLYQVRCPMLELSTLAYTCISSAPAAVSMLQWLHSLQPEWFDMKHDSDDSVVNKTALLTFAAQHCNLALIQWLRCELQAGWCAVADIIRNDNGRTVVPAWEADAVICALDNGLDFKFDCSKLKPERQLSEVCKADAAVLWQWLHKESNMHRCTCGSA
jgi:hypothetical protein